MRNISDTFFREKQKNILYSKTLFRKSYRLWDNVQNGRSRHSTKTICYGACALEAGYLRLQTHTQNM